MYVITGATGNIGSKVADTLLDNGAKVRVIGRNADRLQRFVARGAEAAVGNMKDSTFLTRAFSGATAVFAMIPPEYTAQDFRAYQNEIGSSINAALKNTWTTFVVNLSSQGADLPDGTGPILGLHDQEERLNQLNGVNVLHLRCSYFMENLLMFIPAIREKGLAAAALRPDQKIAMIATRDIAAVVARHLVKRDFRGKGLRDLLGQRDLSLNEALAVIGREIGKPDLKYVQLDYADAARDFREMGISADVSRSFVEMYQALNEGRFAVKRPRTAANTTPTSIEEFATVFAGAYAASGHRQAA